MTVVSKHVHRYKVLFISYWINTKPLVSTVSYISQYTFVCRNMANLIIQQKETLTKFLTVGNSPIILRSLKSTMILRNLSSGMWGPCARTGSVHFRFSSLQCTLIGIVQDCELKVLKYIYSPGKLS